MPFLGLISRANGRKESRFVDPVRVVLIAAALAAPVVAIESQKECPQPAERTDRFVKWFLAHPYVADPPYASEVGLPENYMEMLAPYRERIDLVGLTWEEVERLTERDAATCRSLEDWLFSQPGIGPEARYGFYRARDRYVVAVWRQLEPGRIRLGLYQDSFVAVLTEDLSLIEKVH